ncbi:hypothetical protein ACWEPR_38780, partial [Streptomyces sp. NPDC004290]
MGAPLPALCVCCTSGGTGGRTGGCSTFLSFSGSAFEVGAGAEEVAAGLGRRVVPGDGTVGLAEEQIA